MVTNVRLQGRAVAYSSDRCYSLTIFCDRSHKFIFGMPDNGASKLLRAFCMYIPKLAKE